MIRINHRLAGVVLAPKECIHFAQGESKAAYMADMAGFPALRARIDGWDELDPVDQSSMLYGLRCMLQACPACDGPIVGGEQRVKS